MSNGFGNIVLIEAEINSLLMFWLSVQKISVYPDMAGLMMVLYQEGRHAQEIFQ